MLASDIFARADGMLGAFDPLRIRTEESDISPKLSVLSHISRTAGGEIYVPSRSVSTMYEVAELIRITDVDLCIIDGVYLMKASRGYSSRWERVAEVSNTIKEVALDTETPIVGVTQLKRVGAKEDYDPEDLAYSDALGQDADFVMAIRSVDKSIGRIEVQLIKNRFGPEIGAMLRFDYKTMSLIDESIEGMTDW
jgi:replicative DNA helicase